MRKLLLALLLAVLALSPNSSDAADRPSLSVLSRGKLQGPNSHYRGYFLDLSEIAGEKYSPAIADALRYQLDIVESVGLSARVLKFFRQVPIRVDELACLGGKADINSDGKTPPVLADACYGPFASERSQRAFPRAPTELDSEKLEWSNPDPVDLAEDTKIGVVLVRPLRSLRSGLQEPIMLHEFLHAYHAKVLPGGFKNPGVLLYYKLAKENKLYPETAYLLTNEREFFAVSASVFLFGKASQEPFTRSNLKQQQPDYYRYLVWLFGFDPDREPRTTPVVSAN